MKRCISLVAAAAMVLSLGACASSSTPQQALSSTAASPAAAPAGDEFSSLAPVELTVASASSSKNDIFQTMVAAAAVANEKSGGKLKINVIWDGTLGNDAELIESCMAGDVDMAFVATSSIASYVKEAAVFDLPCLFTDIATANKACQAFSSTFSPYMEQKGLKVLGICTDTFRGLSTNVKIEKPDDFKGMSIRTPENKYYMAFYSGLGASPTPLAFGELYVALQQGLVDAQDNPAQAVYATKFYEVQKYYMDPCAITYVFPIIMNLDTYNSLPEPYQKLLVEFAEIYGANAAADSPSVRDAALEAMKDSVTVLPVTDGIKSKLVEAAGPVETLLRKDLGDELVEKWIACAKNAAKA